MPTTTIYADPAGGYLSNSSATYTTARTGTAVGLFPSVSSFTVGQQGSSGTYYCYQGFMAFDTSSIPADSATDVTLSLWMSSDGSTNDFDVEIRPKSWMPTLELADWLGINLDYAYSYPLLASRNTLSWPSGAYADLTSTPAFAHNLVRGYTQLVILSSRLRTHQQPGSTTSERMDFYDAERTGTTNDPKLVVTHDTASIARKSSTVGLGTDQYTPTDGTKWTGHTGPPYPSVLDYDGNLSAQWYDIAYGNGKFVAVGQPYSGSAQFAYSKDGSTWTWVPAPTPTGNWKAVGYGNGLFVAVAESGTGTQNRIATSPDGINWTLRSYPAEESFQSVAYGNGTFVVTAGGTYCYTSTDGVTWTQQNMGLSVTWYGITYGNGLFVACSNSSTTTSSIRTSPDGITWTQRTVPANNGWWRDVVWGGDKFVAVASSSVTSAILTSPDGVTWTLRTGSSTASDNVWNAVTYGNGVFIAVGDTPNILRSTDGITWTKITTPSSVQYFKCITYAKGRFVAVGRISNPRVITSP